MWLSLFSVLFAYFRLTIRLYALKNWTTFPTFTTAGNQFKKIGYVVVDKLKKNPIQLLIE